MTYDNTDDNDDGTVEAPVNNQSVDTDDLTLGETGPVTGLFGDTDEAIPVMGGTFVNDRFTTTNAIYDTVSAGDEPRIPEAHLRTLTGVGDVAIGFNCRLQQNDNDTDTVYARLEYERNGLPDTEVSAAATEALFSGYEPISGDKAAGGIGIQMKAPNGGTAVMTFATWSVAVIPQ